MSAAQAHVDKMELRKSYRNVWHTDLMSTMAADTPYCCFALFCPNCASYLLRKRALYGDMSRYQCCGGYMPCSGKCGERKCPVFCLCTEVFCCFGNSVASTRFLLQDEFNIHTTKCDNCIIGFMICVQQLACICSIIACLVGSDELSDASDLLTCLADQVYCTVCACMQTQHKVEMDKRDGKFGIRPMEVPPVQEMSRIDHPYPPNVQYGQPQYYGYPPPPPHHAQGYPPAMYPPPPHSHGYPPGTYPPPPPGQGYPPHPTYPPPPQAQVYPPTAYPPQQPPPQGHGNKSPDQQK